MNNDRQQDERFEKLDSHLGMISFLLALLLLAQVSSSSLMDKVLKQHASTETTEPN